MPLLLYLLFFRYQSASLVVEPVLFVGRITIRRLAPVVVVGVTGSLPIASAAIARLLGSTAIFSRLLNLPNMVEMTLVFGFDPCAFSSCLATVFTNLSRPAEYSD